MTEPATFPEQAPFELIAKSRELLRPKIRKARFNNGGANVAVFLWLMVLSTSNSGRHDGKYWLLALSGVIAGCLVTTAVDSWYTHSDVKRQAAVQKAWSRAIRPTAPSGRSLSRWLTITLWTIFVIALVAALSTSLILFLSVSIDFTSGQWPLAIRLTFAVLGVATGCWGARYLETYRWTTVLWPGVLDPAVAREIVLTVRRADKEQYYAEILQRRQSATTDAIA
jgi:H+/Cl- antiporter ClcA